MTGGLGDEEKVSDSPKTVSLSHSYEDRQPTSSAKTANEGGGLGEEVKDRQDRQHSWQDTGGGVQTDEEDVGFI